MCRFQGTALRRSVKLVFDDVDFADERLSGVIVEPIALRIAVCQASEAIALNLNGNGKRQAAVSLSKVCLIALSSHTGRM